MDELSDKQRANFDANEKYKDYLRKSTLDITSRFDKAFLTLIPTTIWFSIKEFQAKSTFKYVVYVIVFTWCCNVLSLIALLLMMFFSQKAFNKKLKIIEETSQREPIELLSLLTIIFYVVGILFLLLFEGLKVCLK